MFVAGSIMGCGASDHAVDAQPEIVVDAVANTLSGLGQSCGPGLPACPSNAPTCRMGLCSLVCHAGASLNTNAQGQVMGTTPASFIPDNPVCAAQYHGGEIGEPICGVIGNVVPPDSPLQANKTYAFDAFCVVTCLPLNTCPTGLTCKQLRCVP